jgi:hypothetical protein
MPRDREWVLLYMIIWFWRSCNRSYVTKKGELSIDKIVAAVDCGLVVNPDGVQAQMEVLLFMVLLPL